VGNRQNGTPKKDLRLPFSLVRLASPSSQTNACCSAGADLQSVPFARFFWACKRNEQHLIGRTKKERKKMKKARIINPRQRII
jgi:hypothetical protein